MTEYRAFSEWWDEVENFSTRGYRATEELGPGAFLWLHTVWNIAYRAGRTAPMTPTPQDRNSEGTPAPQMPTHIAGFRS